MKAEYLVKDFEHYLDLLKEILSGETLYESNLLLKSIFTPYYNLAVTLFSSDKEATEDFSKAVMSEVREYIDCDLPVVLIETKYSTIDGYPIITFFTKKGKRERLGYADFRYRKFYFYHPAETQKISNQIHYYKSKIEELKSSKQEIIDYYDYTKNEEMMVVLYIFRKNYIKQMNEELKKIDSNIEDCNKKIKELEETFKYLNQGNEDYYKAVNCIKEVMKAKLNFETEELYGEKERNMEKLS